MTYYVGIEVSMEESSICIILKDGDEIDQGKVPTHPGGPRRRCRQVGGHHGNHLEGRDGIRVVKQQSMSANLAAYDQTIGSGNK